jgi:hypothetical protein
MPHDFTPAEKQALARDGFVIREGAFGPPEVAEIVGACEDLVESLVRNRRPSVRKLRFDHSRSGVTGSGRPTATSCGVSRSHSPASKWVRPRFVLP